MIETNPPAVSRCQSCPLEPINSLMCASHRSLPLLCALSSPLPRESIQLWDTFVVVRIGLEEHV
jgi:hypothetical protein